MADMSNENGLFRLAIEVMSKQAILTLATSHDDEPWAARVFFGENASEGEIHLYFASRRPSKKWRQLKGNSRVAFSIAGDQPSRWLQGSGQAFSITEEGERNSAEGRIRAKSAAFDAFVGLVDTELFKIVVSEVRVVDLASKTPSLLWRKSG